MCPWSPPLSVARTFAVQTSSKPSSHSLATPSACYRGLGNLKVPQVVRRGCKRCFGLKEQKVSQESIAPPKPSFAPVQLSFAPVQEAFGVLGSKELSHPLLTGPYPQYGWDFPEEIPEELRKDPGNALRSFPGIPSRVRLGSLKPYNSRHLRLPEHFQNSLPPSTAGDASFFRFGSGEGLSELVMEFPAVLGVFLTNHFWEFPLFRPCPRTFGSQS